MQSPQRKLNTGSGPAERQEIEPGSPWWAVHVARYRFAVSHATDRRVLDVACGTGYGMATLGDVAREVVGVDLETEAAIAARAQLGTKSGGVLVADASELPFTDASFDLIVTFETIEHLEERNLFLKELSRVLTRDGFCLLSTPNAKQTGAISGRPLNPYHVFEYTPRELDDELRQHFAEVNLLGQILDTRFRIPPFYHEQKKLLQQSPMWRHILLWRALRRFPAALRDRASEFLWGHPYFPSAEDYQFSESTVDTASVLVAVCGNSARE